MPQANNIQPPAEQDLPTLAKQIRDHHREIGHVVGLTLGRALDAGDLIIKAQAIVSQHASTTWKIWLQENCFMGVSTAQRYQQLARHRSEIEAEISRMPELSLRAARRLIAKTKSKPKTRAGATEAQAGATEAREPTELEEALTKALQHALSLQTDAPDDDTPAVGVADALNGLLSRLQAVGLDLHGIRIVIDTRARPRRIGAPLDCRFHSVSPIPGGTATKLDPSVAEKMAEQR